MIGKINRFDALVDDERARCPACASPRVHSSGGLHWCDACGCEKEALEDDELGGEHYQ